MNQNKDVSVELTNKDSCDNKKSRRPGNFRKGKDQRKRIDPKIPGTKARNDLSFWTKYPELMDTAARYPWMHIAGTPLKTDGLDVILPNVAIQYYHPIPGWQDAATSPLNLAFRQMYLDMHRRYRGLGAYQAADIAITIICIASALELLVLAERIYGIVNRIPVKSRIQPEGLLNAMGFTMGFITDLKSHLADYRYRVNRLIDLAKRLPLPHGMTFFDNHVALNAFVYADSEDERADLLVFQPSGYFTYQTTGDAQCINNAGTAVFTSIYYGAFTSTESFLNVIEGLLNKLLSDDDVLRITSDFIACYGEENMQVLVPMPEDYGVMPVYSETILNKWHNSERFINGARIGYVTATANTTRTTGMLFSVFQEDNIVYSTPCLAPGGATWKQFDGGTKYMPCISPSALTWCPEDNCHVADSWEADPSLEIRVESLLWKADVIYCDANDSSGEVGVQLWNFATEIMGDLKIFCVSKAVATALGVGVDVTHFAYANANACYRACSDLSHFDWHPYVMLHTGAIRTTKVDGLLGDTDNVTTVTSETISKVVDAALLSAFKVDVQFNKSSN